MPQKYRRWKLDAAMLCVLEQVRASTPIPDAEELSSLACLFDVDVRRVRVWFQNQRQRQTRAAEGSPALPP